MRFKSRTDRYFMGIMWTIIGIVTLIVGFSLWPVFKAGDPTSMIISAATYLVSIVVLLWIMYAIVYEFREEYLYVQGGPFRSKINYKDITYVTSTRQIFVGYRLLKARDAIEIHYQAGMFGGVKITPEKQDVFFEELKKRNPNIRIEL